MEDREHRARRRGLLLVALCLAALVVARRTRRGAVGLARHTAARLSLQELAKPATNPAATLRTESKPSRRFLTMLVIRLSMAGLFLAAILLGLLSQKLIHSATS